MNSSAAQRRGRLAPYFFVLAAAVLLTLLPQATFAGNEPEATPLPCGKTVRGELAAGRVARFQFDAAENQRVVIDAVDISDHGQLLGVRVHGPGGISAHTCTGRIQPPTRAVTQLVAGERYYIEISDCGHDHPVEYALTMNSVASTAQNCAPRLVCDGDLNADFAVPSEVDSYRFEGTVGESVQLQTSDDSDDLVGVELRVFDPDGLPLSSDEPGTLGCASPRAIVLPKTGVYTVLANPCFGGGSGAYRIGWYPETCPPITQSGWQSSGAGIEIRTSYDGKAVVEIATSPTSCGFAHSAGFVWQPNPALAIENGRFTGHGLLLPARNLAFDIDGTVRDVDGDGQIDQAIGGLSFAKYAGRCNLNWHTTALRDDDGDGWSNVIEEQMGSRPDSVTSSPESRTLPSTVISGPDCCHDFFDNDGDGMSDDEDSDCQPTPLAEASAATLYAGRDSNGEALSFGFADGGTSVLHFATAGLTCGAVTLSVSDLNLNVPIENGRFSASGLRWAGDSLTWGFDGVVFDADGDSVPDQALGGVLLRTANAECRLKWWATSHLDSDSDGWSDSAERRLGSDYQPLPVGDGNGSTPESSLVPSTTLLGASVCQDGIDNDLDTATDDADNPDCPPSSTPPVTATPTPPFPATRTPTLPPTTTPLGSACPGDCDGNRYVTVDEVQRGVSIVLGVQQIGQCSALDRNEDSGVTVDELLTAVNHALTGCFHD